MKEYKVTVTWTMTKEVIVKANNEEEAEELAIENTDLTNGQYLEDSMDVFEAEEL